MLAKILTLVVILLIIYFVFFKFAKKDKNKTTKNQKQVENFVECSKCKTFVPIEDSIISNAKYICKDCIRS